MTGTADPEVVQLASRARAGQALDVLPELLAMADTAEVADDDRPWQAAFAATEILFWQDRFTAAADLMEAVAARAAAGSGERLARFDELPDALLAAELHAGVPATPRLRRMLDALPGGRPATQRIARLLDRLPHTDVARLLPGGIMDVDAAPSALDPPADRWADGDLSALTESQRAVVWDELVRANQRARTVELYDAGHRPARWWPAIWLTACLAAAGRLDAAERWLIDAGAMWWPVRSWDCLPDMPVLQPALRVAATDAVRHHYLTAPLGPEAAGETLRVPPPAERRYRLDEWRPASRRERNAPVTRLGGRPSWRDRPRWPWWRGRPLPFLGQFALRRSSSADDAALVLVWMSNDPDAETWKPEGAGNVAVVQPGGALPDWVRWRGHGIGPTVLPRGVLVPDAPAGGPAGDIEPDWLQFDETPPTADRFVCQLGPPIDDRGMVDFGGGGEGYVFVSEDLRHARFLWQTT